MRTVPLGARASAARCRYNTGPVKAFDRTLQRWRIGKVAPHLAAGGRVLDVGCADAMSAVPGEILPLAGAGCGRRVLAQVEESLLVP